MTTTINYYPINENSARVANDINSFSNYKAGSATAGYKASVDEVYKTVDRIQEEKPQYYERALYMADRYAKKYAEYLNDYYRNEASCPSIMICGAGNFPVRKKEKQNSRREALMRTYNYLNDYKYKIESLLYYDRPIMAADENAIEALQDKINELTQAKETAKDFNKFIRNGGKIEEYDGSLTSQQLMSIKCQTRLYAKPVEKPQLDTTNLNAEIRRLQNRLDKLTVIKNRGTLETPVVDTDENELFKVVENTEIMRFQLFFEGKPSDAARDILKHNGFKWSPSNKAWQRQLTDNARYTFKRIASDLCNAL